MSYLLSGGKKTLIPDGLATEPEEHYETFVFKLPTNMHQRQRLITIPVDIYNHLGLKGGDVIRVAIRKI